MSSRKLTAATALAILANWNGLRADEPKLSPLTTGRTIIVNDGVGTVVSPLASGGDGKMAGPGCPPGGCGNGNCESGTCAPCVDMCNPCCCDEARAFFSAEYLFYFIKNAPVNFPVATGSPRVNQGVLGVPGTDTLLGNQDLDYGNFAGFRVNGGTWINHDRNMGFMASGFLLESKTLNRTINGGPDEVLARPFFDTVVGAENSRLLTSPDAFGGGVTLNTSARLWGAEADPVFRVRQYCNSSLDFITGFKFANLEEALDIFDTSTSLPRGLTSFNGAGFGGPNVTTSVHDHFSTQNRFYGGLLGTQYNYESGKFDLGLTGKVGIGTIHQAINVSGTSTLSGVAPAATTVDGGLLAVSSNSGRQSKNVFGVMPEAEVRAGYRISCNASVFVGYNFMYISSVVRPGDQVDRNINPTLIPTHQAFGVPFGAPQPVPQFNSTDFWAHGATIGFALTF